MKRKSNKYNVIYCILAVTTFMYGCGNGNNSANSQKVNEIKQEEITYVAQSLPLPEYESFDGAWSDGSNLYYAAAVFDQASQQYETAFYTLKQGAAEPEMNFRLAENQRVLKMTMDGSGNSYYLGYEEVPNEGGDGQITSDYILYKLDQQGVPQMSLDLKEYVRGQEQALVQNLAVDGENRIVLTASDQNVYILDPNGKLLFETRAGGVIFDICTSGGKVFAAHGGIDGVEIREIDISGKKLSAKLEHNIPGSRFYMAAGENGNLLIASEESVYQYDLETGDTSKKFDWQTYDLTGITAGILLPYGENGVLAVSRDYGTYPMKTDAIVFREAAEGESVILEKTVLTLGVSYPPTSAVNEERVAFNKSNSDFKIELKNYGEDYTRLYTEVMAGNGPDLLMLPSYRIAQLAERGLVEDLYPYFNEDVTLNRSDFLENILNAFETEGHLYRMPVNFMIDTIAGKSSLVGEESGWNLEELITFAEGFQEGTEIFDDASKSGVLHLLKYAYIDQLVDTDNIGNPLDRELLVKMLEFANRYKSDDQYVYSADLSGRVMKEQLILFDHRVSYGVYYRAYSNSVFGEPVTFIGYPAAEGNGNLIDSSYVFAISSGSGHKDIAWTFISGLLSKDTQIKIGQDYATSEFAFPIRKDALEEHFAYFVEGSWHDFIITRDGTSFRREIGKGVAEEDFKPIRDLIQNADTALHVSPDIDQIIEEEAAFYFSGSKPVEEVADVIENRIRTYVNETK